MGKGSKDQGASENKMLQEKQQNNNQIEHIEPHNNLINLPFQRKLTLPLLPVNPPLQLLIRTNHIPMSGHQILIDAVDQIALADHHGVHPAEEAVQVLNFV